MNVKVEGLGNGWYLCGKTMKSGESVPPDGVQIRFDGVVVPKRTGLYASARLLDALTYGRDTTICRVQLEEILGEFDWPDKFVGRARTIIWRVDGEAVLREFARWCARSVLFMTPFADHPDVTRYLDTGEEPDGAREVARMPGAELDWTAQRDAAVWTAVDCLFSASWDGALDRDGYPAHVAARDAAWQAAWSLGRREALLKNSSQSGQTRWKEERLLQEEQLCRMVWDEHDRRVLKARVPRVEP